ncbi:MAG: imidazole glycerol phosphate synthase subunit HisH, partial [Treponemataceae bacterium]|nr:imidazole glycerol phosphate synthase subunit HisH [Treponemataceae bacterium]
LGLLKGSIRRLDALWKEAGIPADGARKTPHMGWNDVRWQNGGSPLFEGVPERTDFYFVHSYVICPEDARIVKASADYGIEIPACVESGSVAAFQFHPEKSGAPGMRILRTFCRGDIRG